MAHHATCAAVIARALYDMGVRHAFGHPGGEVLELIDALETQGISFALVGHESTAAFMAATAGRLTGIPGVCLSTLGPGACNLTLGVASAYLDRDPLLAFSARVATHRIGRSNKQNLPLNNLFGTISKWSIALDGAATETTIRDAMRVAATPPWGPVYVSIPADVATGPDRPDTLPPQAPVSPLPDMRVLDSIVTALNHARRPVGVVGIAMNAVKDAPAVRRFFAETGIPFTVTVQAKGIVDETSPGFPGAVAPAAGERHVIEWLQQSDCILGVGFDPVEISQTWHFDAPLHIVANTSVGFGTYHPPSECVGDVATLLDRIRENYRGVGEYADHDIHALRAHIDKAICPEETHSSAGLAPYHLVKRLRALLPDETIVTSDVGAHKNVIGQAWRAPSPHTLLMSNGLSSMGYGPASALAAALIHLDRPVVAITGDAAFAMMVHELETARRLGIAPLFVVLCDRSLAVIKIAQRLRNLPPTGVDFAPVDWAKVAQGFGVRGETAHTFADVERVVGDWLSCREPLVLAVSVDESLYKGLRY
ncbi:MAG: thiamine pyrophosphate-binding protein [candidate division Zixibacteria bacterium]|nr:thiamine pyrophosphate-binding protein [candidate division Zixibacteria bacterium]